MQNASEIKPSAEFQPAPVAWAPRPQATVLATGKDAVRFVDNFVTASISSIAGGSGTEAFVTDTRGHVIALVAILRTDAGLEIIAAPGLGERLRDHLEHFHIREAVDLVDSSDTTGAILIAGPDAVSTLAAVLPTPPPLPSHELGHALVTVADHAVRVVRVAGLGTDGFEIHGPHTAIDALAQSLVTEGVPRVNDAELEAARIAAGYPAPIDIDAKALPQELGRDARAISFTKGCYLGQETVARLDALGHVNRRLAILGIDVADPPSCPQPILLGDMAVGVLTSSCVDPTRGTSIGLGIVHAKVLHAPALAIGTDSARILAVPPDRLESS